MREAPWRLAAYAGLVFATSALVLVVEIVAARLLAPFVGVSLYSWTAIIGVVLAGLSIGNWIGGWWADRGGGERAAGWTLLVASLSVFAILLLLPRFAGPLQEAGFSLAALSLYLAAALFLLPAALLGVLTPLLTTLALQHSTRPGHIVGMMHALAALGSILGTFTTGFLLVQWMGSRNIILATATALLVLSLPLLSGRRALAAAMIGFGGYALSLSSWGYPSPCQRESSYFCLRAVDSSAYVPWGEARSLVLDHLLHGTNHREDPQWLAAPYLHLMDELARLQLAGRPTADWFFAGGGAYTLPRAVRARDPEARLVVAEIDPVVTDVAAENLYIEAEQFEVRHTDARVALHQDPPGSYDVIVGDVFHDIAIPYHLVTREFAALVRSRLRANGLYVLNVVDAYPDARLTKALVKTLSAEFSQVDAWLDGIPDFPTRVTFVLTARDGGPVFKDRHWSRRPMRGWEKVTAPLLTRGTPLADLPELRDDYAPVERLMNELFTGKLGL